MSEFKRGTRIVVRGFGDVALVRRLWAWDERGVFVHSDEQYAVRREGGEYLEPVGFRWDDAFLLPDYENAETDELTVVEWSALRPLASALPNGTATLI